MSKLFGRKKKEPAAQTPAEAIQGIRETEEMLTKKQVFLEKKIEEELKHARANANKNKKVALMALKRKKRYEEQLKKLDGTLQTIDFQREALENASINTEVLQRMREGAKSLQAAHKNLDADQVHNLMDEIADQQETAQEISDAISNPVGFGAQYEDDDLLAELEELEQDELDKTMLNLEEPANINLPDVPTAEPRGTMKTKTATASKATDDSELRELEAWAS